MRLNKHLTVMSNYRVKIITFWNMEGECQNPDLAPVTTLVRNEKKIYIFSCRQAKNERSHPDSQSSSLEFLPYSICLQSRVRLRYLLA